MKGRPIFLIGPRACGKSTVGKALAKRLGWAFVDTDAIVETKNASSIAQMVEERGWQFFRSCESKALQECIRPNVVVSTGGGIVLANENRTLMQESGFVFFLSVPVDELIQRLSVNDNDRPALTHLGTVEEVELVLNERLPLYKGMSHYEIDGAQSVLEIVHRIHDVVTRKV